MRRICTAAATPAMVAPYTHRSAVIGVTALADDVTVSSRAATEPAAAAIRSRSRRCGPALMIGRRAMDPLVGRLTPAGASGSRAHRAAGRIGQLGGTTTPCRDGDAGSGPPMLMALRTSISQPAAWTLTTRDSRKQRPARHMHTPIQRPAGDRTVNQLLSPPEASRKHPGAGREPASAWQHGRYGELE